MSRSRIVVLMAALVGLAAVPTAALAYGGTQGLVSAGGSTTFTLDYAPTLTPAVTTALNAAVADTSLYAHPTFDQVIASPTLAQTMSPKTSCPASNTAINTLDDAAHHIGAWCFPAADQDSAAASGDETEQLRKSTWIPQSVTNSNEAKALSGYATSSATMVGWYESNHLKGDDFDGVNARITVGPSPASGSTAKYKSVLLGVPKVGTDGKLTLGSVAGYHVGGLVWYGHYLYVADASSGIRVFDVNHTYQAWTGSNVVGRVGAKIYAHGFPFVMLQVARFDSPFTGGCDTTPQTMNAKLCTSGISLVRGSGTDSDALISFEHRVTDKMDASKVGARIVRWPLSSTGLLKTTGTTATSTSLYTTPTRNIQGVLRLGSPATYFIAASKSPDKIYYASGVGAAPAVRPWSDTAEQMAYSYDASNPEGKKGKIWSVTELPNRRMLFWAYVSEMN